ncbi:MAG: hypothetical protein U0573_03065 [Phycisphaerales bacterium]|nr:hypothetical protein [Planctomycetota bacterium]
MRHRPLPASLSAALFATLTAGAHAAPSVTIPLTGVSITNGSTASKTSAPATINPALRYRSRTDGTVIGTPAFSLLGALFATPVPLSQALQTLTGTAPDLDNVLGNPAGSLPVGGQSQTLSGSAVVLGSTVTVTATLTVGIDAGGIASFALSGVTVTPTVVGGLKFVSGQVTLDAITCLADLNFDGLVDDADFSLFVADYDALLVASPQTGGDFNGDGQCDDADFSIFVVAYDALLCS